MRIVLDHVVLNVDDATLADDISLTIDTGSLMAVIGPNGAGKSTLLHLIGGDVPPTSGAVHYDDTPVGDIPLRHLARMRSILAQTHTTDVAFTVRQVVAMGRFPYRFDPDNTPGADTLAVDEAIVALDLRELSDRQVRTLSGGEQQRVAAARVLAQNAPIMLLDEPTTALDIKHQESVMALIGSLPAKGPTVVAVLHDLNLATRFDRVALLDSGSITAMGSPDEVLTSELLSSVYGHPIDVVDHPTQEGLLVLPRPESPATA